MNFLLTLLLSVLVTVVLIPAFSRLAIRFRMLDVPNARKVHDAPIPRSGGMAMTVGVLIPLVTWNLSGNFTPAYITGALVLVFIGVLDDSMGLGPGMKFAGQIAAALLVILWGGVQIRSLGGLLPDGAVLPSWIAVPLTLVAVVGITNAVNLADGLDGLAGGICLLVFCCIGYLAYLAGNAAVGLTAAALCGCIFGFLRFNTHPATVFMGDAGSLFLGYSAAVLSLSLTQGNTPLSPLLPLIILGLPILDTVTVMVTRIAQGRSPFIADKNHFHHTLVGIGLQHPEAVLVIYVLQTGLVFAAFAFRFHSDWLLLGGYLAFSLPVLWLFSFARRTGWKMKRYDLLDVVITGHLRRLRDEGIIIKVTYRVFEIAIPLLLLFTCFLPAKVSGRYLPLFGVAAGAALFAVWTFRKEYLGTALQSVLYLLIPIAVYLGETQPAPWLSGAGKTLYNACFGIFAVAIVAISKFTRRRRGFKNTPMDFLIVILAVIVPNLPQQQDHLMGVMAAKIIMLYFSYEVLLAEARGKFGRIAVSSIASLAVLATR
jgi:UDP-GlcNAc:undecaprenyl-phosphate GlcNAc-1-phosphate transferase